MSFSREPAQRLTNAFVVSGGSDAYFYNGTTLAAALVAGGATQVGSLIVAPTAAAITTAVGTVQAAAYAAIPARSATLTDLGTTLTVQVADAADGAVALKLRKVKYQTATSVFVTGYVVEENNYNGGLIGSGTSGGSTAANALKVAVARV